MVSDYTVAALRQSQKNLLIAHIDRTIPFDVKSPMLATTISLMKLGLLRGTEVSRPRGTILTEDGRRAVCSILAHYADQLVLAGLLELTPAAGESAFDILQRERIERAKATLAASRIANPQKTVTAGDPDAQS